MSSREQRQIQLNLKWPHFGWKIDSIRLAAVEKSEFDELLDFIRQNPAGFPILSQLCDFQDRKSFEYSCVPGIQNECFDNIDWDNPVTLKDSALLTISAFLDTALSQRDPDIEFLDEPTQYYEFQTYVGSSVDLLADLEQCNEESSGQHFA